MTEQLIDLNAFEISSNSIQTIWDIENAEKQQLINFIENKIEEKYLKKFDYYDQLLLSLQKEHFDQMSKLLDELNKTNEYLYNLQMKNSNNMIYISVDIENANYLPNYSYGFLVYNKYETKVYCDRLYPQLMEMPNLTELKLDFWGTFTDRFNCNYYNYDSCYSFVKNVFKDNVGIKLINVNKLEIKWGKGFHLKQDIDKDFNYQYRTTEDNYKSILNKNGFMAFPNLKHLIIYLNNDVNFDYQTNNIRVAQGIVELIEFYPCKINKITIILEKEKRLEFIGSLEPLRLFASNNRIECLIE